MKFTPPTAAVLLAGLLGHSAAELAAPDSASKPFRLWEKASGSGGKSFADFYPIANGRIGGMFNGGAASDSVRINEDSFWSGSFLDRVNPDARETVKDMQKLVVEEKFKEAEDLHKLGYIGTPMSTRNYDTMGSFTITQDLPNTNVTEYERWLELSESVGGVHFVSGGVTFQREYLASYPDDVIAVHLTASKPGALKFRVRLDRGAWDVVGLNRHVAYSEPANGDSVIIGGSSQDDNPVKWAAGVRIVASGGKVRTHGDNALCDGADEAVVYFQAWTNYRQKDPKKAVLSDLAGKGKDFKKIRDAHVKDYKQYYDRTSINLGKSTDEQKKKTTPQRMTSIDEDNFDPELAVLFFQLGRYMLISSSRDGDKSLPPNLQGVWNDVTDPAWGGKYTLNINLQMNYWPSLTTGLSDLVQPLNNLLKTMDKRGRKVAKEMYGARGTVTHHNTDMWGDSAPQDNYAPATLWPMAGVWMITHAIEHYRFTGDKKMLKDMWPTLKANAEFALDFLSEYKGHMVTNPSSSPENIFYDPSDDSRTVAITVGPTVDNALLRELFDFIPEAQRVLGVSDKKFVQRVTDMRAKLPPLRLNQYDGLAEWIDDYKEANPGNGHVSHLVTTYPLNHITNANATLFNASITSLNHRLDNGGGDCGWPRVWAVALAGRMFLPEVQHSRLVSQMNECSYNRTMLNIGGVAPFQADGNYGVPASVTEAFLQSHEYVRWDSDDELVPARNTDEDKLPLIRLLPSVPREWAAMGGGSFKGLRARGGFVVSASWDSKGKLKTSTVRSELGMEAVVTIGQTIVGGYEGAKLRIQGKKTARFVTIDGKKGSETKIEGE